MCISGLGCGDILRWILLLVSVQRSTGHNVGIFRYCLWTENKHRKSHFLHIALLLQLPHCFFPSPRLITFSPLANLLVDPKLLHKGSYSSSEYIETKYGVFGR